MIIFLIISLLLSLFLALPSVQTAIAKRFTDKINADTGVNLKIDKLQITLSGAIILKNFIALDEHQDTIFYGKRLRTYIRNPWSINKENRIKFGRTNIDGLNGKIIIYKGQKQSNLDIFIDKLGGTSTKKDTITKAFGLYIQKLQLTNSSFKYFDYNSKNYTILNFSHLQANLSDFEQIADRIAFNLEHMQMHDYRGLQIDRLQTRFQYDNQSIDLKNLILKTPASDVELSLQFISPDKGYTDFNNRIRVKAGINKAIISCRDLNKFSPVFNPDRIITLKTDVSGTLNHLQLHQLAVKTDHHIRLKGRLDLVNLFNDKDFMVNSRIKQLSFSFNRLNAFIPDILDQKLRNSLQVLGDIDMTGKLSYGTQNLNSDVEVLTDLGDLSIKLKMNHLNDISKTSYQGHIVTDNFKIKSFLKEDIDNLSSNFKVKGQGLTLKSMNANFVGNVNAVKYHDYTYHNILVNGDFQRKLFSGQIDIADDNLEMDFDGLLDFSIPKRKLDFHTEVCFANLYNLNFSKDEFSRFEGEINVKAEGTDIEDVVGKIEGQHLKIVNQYDTYLFDDFSLSSQFNDKQERQILFHSTDIIDGYIRGKFKFKSVPLLIQNALGSVFANYKLKPVDNQQYMYYKLQVRNKIVSLLSPGLKIAKNTVIKGKINSNDNLLKLKLLSNKISYFDKDFKTLKLSIDNKNPLYNIFLKVDTINAGFYKFKNLRLLNTTINDTLYLKTKFDGGSQFDDHYDVAFYYTMDQLQNFIFGLQKSVLQFKNTPWQIHPAVNLNRIVYKPAADSLKVDDVGIFHKQEKIGITGIKYKDSLDFRVNLDSINLTHITPELKDFDFDGLINGKIHIAKYKKEILPSAFLTIKQFKLNKQLLGDLNLKISALPGNHVFVDLSVIKEQLQALKLIGYLDLKKKIPELNATLLFNKFPVKPLQNLFKETFTNIHGKLSGKVQLTGKLDNLSYDGKLYLDAFGLKILALNTDYQFDNHSVVYLHDQTFELKKAKFFDTKFKTNGDISGVIKHHNFDHWYLDLHINTDNLLVLDTPPDPLEMFYGTVFTGGKARIYGYVDRLKIDAEMQTKPKTNFVITLSDVETIGDNDFVRIISKKDYNKEKQNKKKRHKIYEGLEMNFDLDITPDAQVEILLDQEFGSTLVAKGTGLVLMNVNTNGQFNIFGDFAVEEGIYNFKYAGVIDKKFVVEPGSYISWEGDPYNATLDIKAMYETFADPTVLLADQGLTAKKMPVEAIIYLKDRLMKPTITFDLKLPKANAVLRSQVDYILSDPDKKTLQVLSLLSFGDFINENDYNLSKRAGEGVVKTFTEKGLNILNGLMAQDDKFQVNLNYTRGDENIEKNIVTDPQVGLSLVTQINKKVYINGKVAIPVGRYTKSSIVGDVELEVYLDEKGNLVFRVFNKQTELEYIGQQEGYTQGIGISYQVDFDTFSDILKKFGISVKTEQ